MKVSPGIWVKVEVSGPTAAMVLNVAWWARWCASTRSERPSQQEGFPCGCRDCEGRFREVSSPFSLRVALPSARRWSQAFPCAWRKWGLPVSPLAKYTNSLHHACSLKAVLRHIHALVIHASCKKVFLRRLLVIQAACDPQLILRATVRTWTNAWQIALSICCLPPPSFALDPCRVSQAGAEERSFPLEGTRGQAPLSPPDTASPTSPGSRRRKPRPRWVFDTSLAVSKSEAAAHDVLEEVHVHILAVPVCACVCDGGRMLFVSVWKIKC